MVELAIEEFFGLSSNGFYTLKKVRMWLKKYLFMYNHLTNLHSKMYLNEIGGNIIRLPPLHLKPSIETKFMELYENLNTLSILQKKEKYFQLETNRYKNHQGNSGFIKTWLGKNEKLGSEDYVCFLIDYLDYSEDEFHLLVINPFDNNREIFIERKSFCYTIEFLEIFNQNYYDGKK
jgi:hypothetical protein